MTNQNLNTIIMENLVGKPTNIKEVIKDTKLNQSELELLSNKSNTIKPIIVENNGKRETYLDDFNCDVIYTDNNNLKYNHKAENELLDVKYIINKYNIDDNDLIIKLTGRYCLLNDSFINLCLLEKYNYDVFIKFL